MTAEILEVRALAAGYGGSRALTGIGFTVSRGEWLSVVGPNGSGKTTLLRCISGQLEPLAGRVLIGGHDMSTQPQMARRLLGFAHPPERLPSLLTGRQCLEVYAAAHGLKDPGQVLELAASFRMTAVLDCLVGSYSLGMRQKLSVLLALINDPALILLDESFNGLDPASSLFLKNELRDRVLRGQCAVLVATHALDLVLRYSTRALLLMQGRVSRQWDGGALGAMHADPASFELALAHAVGDPALGESPAPAPRVPG